MSPQPPTKGAPADLELVKNGITLVSLTFGINLYTSRSFYDCAAQVLGTFDAFLKHCPAQKLNYYATETMKVHKPVNKRVLSMLSTWLQPDAPRKHYVALELKSAAVPQDTPRLKYQVWAVDASAQSNILSVALPAAAVQEQPREMLEFVQRLADIFPFRCGAAGYAFECSRYEKAASEMHAWSTSMRHPGIDIIRIPFDAKAVGGDGIKSVNWLTLLDSDLVKQLGGTRSLRGKLSRDIDLITTKNGLVVKAGPIPAVGDINRGEVLPLYREVHALLAPWIETATKRSMGFQVKDSVERTKAWYRRLGRE